MKNKTILLIAILFVSFFFSSAHATSEGGISFGFKLIGASREGKNQNSRSKFESDDGGQFGFNLAYSKGRAYLGTSFKGGRYKFDGRGPDQITSTTTGFSNGSLKHSEINLIAGYFFWEHVSLFVGIKGIEDKWENRDHKQSFTGIGGGISGILPMNPLWDVYGSAAFIPAGVVETNDTESGDGNSATIEFGTVYHLTQADRITFGFKFTTVTYEFDSGDEQEHKTKGLFLGYSHHFPF